MFGVSTSYSDELAFSNGNNVELAIATHPF